MKVDCVIVLGPSGEFHPLVSEKIQKFSLPFLNIPLLKLSINYLAPYASKIFIFCLEKYGYIVEQMIVGYEVPIEITTTTSYEGMSHILMTVQPKLKSSCFIMCKGDIYGLKPLRPLLESFVHLGADMYASLTTTSEYEPPMCLDSCNYLKMYNTEDFPFIKNEKLILTTKFIIKDFYIIKTSVLGLFNDTNSNMYSFKSNIIPFLIRENQKIKVSENMIFQIKNMNDYLSQLDFKNNLFKENGNDAYNLLDSNCDIGDKTLVEDSIVGENSRIGHGCVIKRSILMDHIIIEPSSIIDSCVVCSRCLIKGNSELKHCKVGESYTFEYPIKASFDVFSQD